MIKKIVLASSSPRRKDILNKIGLEFDIIPSSFEEILDNLDFSYEKIEDLAYNKAKEVLPNVDYSALIIGADTVVVLGGQILGKPKDEVEAVEMLQRLSGQTHSVVTSLCIINSENLQKKVTSTTSYVEFEDLSDEMIKEYVNNFNPLDKAGSYGIQELPEGFVKRIEGSFENIIGLCPLAVLETLKFFK